MIKIIRKILRLLFVLAILAAFYSFLVLTGSGIESKSYRYSLYDGEANHLIEISLTTKSIERPSQWVPKPNDLIEVNLSSLDIRFIHPGLDINIFPTDSDTCRFYLSEFPFYLPESFTLRNRDTNTWLVITPTMKGRIKWRLYQIVDVDGKKSKEIMSGPAHLEELQTL